jgi:hypothetical protein
MKPFLILFIFVLPVFVFAQNTPEQLVDNFFQKYVSESPDAAIDFIFTSNRYMDKAVGNVQEIKDRLNKAVGMLDKYYNYEIFSKKILGESFTLIDCMVKYDRQPIQITFTLYKPDKEWYFQNIKFDYNLEDDVKTAPNVIK